jgi:tetratricopeptide (TPR) repeat protein
VERRLTIHAGGAPEALTRGEPAPSRRGEHARVGGEAAARRGGAAAPSGVRRRAWMIALALVALASSAEARPKGRAARVAFDRGVAAYQKGNFEAAATALGKSYELERDTETLFAWAQSERLLNNCDKAIELYEKLLGLTLAQANREAVEQKLAECREIVAEQKPIEPAPVAPAPVEPPPTQRTDPPARTAVRAEISLDPQRSDAPAGRSWYKDPIALGLLGGGLIATGAGAGLLVSAMSLDSDSKRATSYEDAEDLSARARSRGNLALITGGVGGALLVGGLVWIVLRDDGSERSSVTGWLAPGGGGIAVGGAF